MIQGGGVYATFCQEEEGMLLQKYHDRRGRCITILFNKSIGVGGRCDSPDLACTPTPKQFPLFEGVLPTRAYLKRCQHMLFSKPLKLRNAQMSIKSFYP